MTHSLRQEQRYMGLTSCLTGKIDGATIHSSARDSAQAEGGNEMDIKDMKRIGTYAFAVGQITGMTGMAVSMGHDTIKVERIMKVLEDLRKEQDLIDVLP